MGRFAPLGAVGRQSDLINLQPIPRGRAGPLVDHDTAATTTFHTFDKIS